MTGSILALSIVLAGVTVEDVPAKLPSLQPFVGKVVPIKVMLEKKGIKVDPDEKGLVLVTDSGRLYPIVKDEGSRPFFLDARLQDRPMHFKARLLPGSDLLQVTELYSLKNGQLHEVYYWCEVCQLRFREAGVCSCCGGKTEFFEVPLK